MNGLTCLSQLTNYALQKQIRDHERHEKVQTSEREQHIHQMSQFESQFKQMTSLTKEVGTKQMKLEKDSKNCCTIIMTQNIRVDRSGGRSGQIA